MDDKARCLRSRRAARSSREIMSAREISRDCATSRVAAKVHVQGESEIVTGPLFRTPIDPLFRRSHRTGENNRDPSPFRINRPRPGIHRESPPKPCLLVIGYSFPIYLTRRVIFVPAICGTVLSKARIRVRENQLRLLCASRTVKTLSSNWKMKEKERVSRRSRYTRCVVEINISYRNI